MEQLLIQLIAILITVYVVGSISRLLGFQWVIGEIIAGLILGPSLLGGLFPALKTAIFPTQSMPILQALGEIGLLIYMFSLGSRLDTHLMVRHSGKALGISIMGILFPFLSGGLLAWFLFPGFHGAQATLLSFLLMLGTAMSITAFPVLARLLAERNMLGSKVGTLALTSAAFDDIVAWCLLALVIAVVHMKGLPSVLLTIALTIVFIVVMITVVRPLLQLLCRHIQRKELLITIAVVLLFLSAYCTHIIGIHPVFGAFLMGVILPRRIVFIEQIQSFDRINGILFLPLYFVYSGLRTQITLLNEPILWGVCLLVILVACAGKILGGVLVMRSTGESWRDALSLGTLMNTRGLVELVVLNIGLDLGVLSPTMFAMMVIMALVTTMMASPMLTLLGHRPQRANADDPQEVTPTTAPSSMSSES